MKKLFTVFAGTLLPLLIFAQKDYRVVFDLTSKDTMAHKNIVRWVNEISREEPNSRLEVVLYGKSLDMVTKDRSVVAEAVKQLAQKKNVAFKVCAVAMQNNNVDKSQLLPGVQIVPDGIYEIITRQRQGWGYIKAAQ